MTIDEKRNKIRQLMERVAKLVNQQVYDSGTMASWKIIDPAKVDQFWNLNDLLDDACRMYLEDSIPWDRDLIPEVEVIQVHPEDTPVAVEIKRPDFRPSVMQAARNLFVFITLP